MKKSILIFLGLIIIAALGILYTRQSPLRPAPGDGGAPDKKELIASVTYYCNEGKTIKADFYLGKAKPVPAPGEPPIPDGSAELALSDGRVMALKQTISADGARYSNGNPAIEGNETFVFWSKGNGGLVLEDNEEKSYIGCILVVSDPGGLPEVYENSTDGFSIRYPVEYTVNPDYQYQEFGPGKEISGVSFTIPADLATGTNLAEDSYLSVEKIPEKDICTAGLFLDRGERPLATTTITDNGIEYSVASSTGAAAGNRYEEMVYALTGTNPCIAVRYLIHYGVIENYPPGAVKEFDRAALLDQFDAIRRTLIIE
jgi:membrane-bound inhibitor of C-type lysozyme